MMNRRALRTGWMALVLLSTPSGLAAQPLAPAGTGVNVAVTGVVGVMGADLTGPMQVARTLAPRVELALGATPRLGVLAAWSTQGVTIDREAFEIVSLELGLRYTGHVGRTWRPFADVGMARRAFHYETPQVIRATTLAPWGAVGLVRRPRGPVGVEVALTGAPSTFDQFTVDDVIETLQPVRTRMLGARIGVRFWFD